MPCELCAQPGGEVLWQDAQCRVIQVDDPDYPGFCRVIWGAHVKEMTDLAPAERDHLMRVVYAVEEALRQVLSPHKINLASLGNVTPHLHWHLIPRYPRDRHFPDPIWAAPLRVPDSTVAPDLGRRLRQALQSRLEPRRGE